MWNYIIALIVFLAWIFFAIFLTRFRKDEMKKRGMSFWGPFLMMRTDRGQKFLRWLSKKERFWKAFGNFSIALVVVFMIAVFLIMVWTATIVPSVPREQAPTPQMLVGIPGVNPLIPVWYGIWGIAVAIVIHEFCHGILAFNGGMRIKSMGLVFMALPMGAFVEPEEEDIKNAPRIKRMRVYAAGPSSNILFSLACIVVFSFVFMGSISPAAQGTPVSYVLEDTPAWDAGIVKGDFITSFNSAPIVSTSDFRRYMNNSRAGDTVGLELYNKGSGSRNTTIHLGYWKDYDQTYNGRAWYRQENASLGIMVESVSGTVVVTRIIYDSPSYGHLFEGDRILALNGTPITSNEFYNTSLSNLIPGEATQISLERNGTTIHLDLTPGAGKGYMGILPVFYDVKGLGMYLHRPLHDLEGPGDLFSRFMGFIAMPFQRIGPEDKIAPMEGLFTELYVVDGPLSFLPETLFWVFANLLFWAFWISLMVGLTNSLPAVPMDGGFIFHDLLTGFFSRKKSADEKKVEKMVDRVAITLALTVMMLILWQLIGPRI